jgi:glycosyltransferase involved in cell wall biosynthesis
MKLSILVNGWINIHHSYAIVNCMQLIHFHKVLGDKLEIYVREPEYYAAHWCKNSQSIYNEEYTEILKQFRQWNGEHVDLIYSITFPYDVSITGDIPKCIYYTCELKQLGLLYFKPQFAANQDIKTHLHAHPQLYFAPPSVWTAIGMELEYNLLNSRNRIIPHGADTNIFKPIPRGVRDRIRANLGVSNDTILLGLFGSMTQNKGIHVLLAALHDIVFVKGRTNYKLLLKGNNNLYESQQLVEKVLQELHVPNEILNHIVYIGHTFTFDTCNEMYNIVDLYVSPYLAEGFNLSPLEALTAGTRVLVPLTGSTEEYMKDIYNNGGSDFITYVKSIVITNQSGQSLNQIEVEDLISSILSVDMSLKPDPTHMIEYISKEYSWTKAVESLYEYFLYILEARGVVL